MSNQQPTITTTGPHYRQFTTSAIAVQAIIINQNEQILLLFNPIHKQGWQTVSGAFEAGETLLAGTRREVAEELGPHIRVRPLGLVHAENFHYDEKVRYMLATYYLFAYQGGKIEPGDDMFGSDFRWWSLAKLSTEKPPLHISTKYWILTRSVELYRLWLNQPDQSLQPSLLEKPGKPLML